MSIFTYQYPPPLEIHITEHPIPTQYWPYKYIRPDHLGWMDINMNWDDPATRKLCMEKLNGFGVFLVKRVVKNSGKLNGQPVGIYQITYAFDVYDVDEDEKDVIYRRPMYRFRTACLSSRQVLKHDFPGISRHREDMGIGFVEAPEWLVLQSAHESSQSIYSIKHEAFTEEHTRAVLKKDGIDYDKFCICPVPDAELLAKLPIMSFDEATQKQLTQVNMVPV